MNRHFPSASRQPKPRSNLRDRARSEPASLDAPMDRRERCRCGSAQPREGEVYFHQCLVTSGIQIFCGQIFPNHQPLSRPSSGRQQPQVQVHSTTSAPLRFKNADCQPIRLNDFSHRLCTTLDILLPISIPFFDSWKLPFYDTSAEDEPRHHRARESAVTGLQELALLREFSSRCDAQ